MHLSALSKILLRARCRVQDADAFLEANKKIHNLIETALPPLVEAFNGDELDADARDRLEASLASVQKLEGRCVRLSGPVISRIIFAKRCQKMGDADAVPHVLGKPKCPKPINS